MLVFGFEFDLELELQPNVSKWMLARALASCNWPTRPVPPKQSPVSAPVHSAGRAQASQPVEPK